MFQQIWARTSAYFFHPVDLIRNYERSNFRADILSGLTVAIMMLPMAIAYAMIAELPPATGLYAAIVGSIAGALWGSSWNLQTGPTNPASLLVLATLLPIAEIGGQAFLAAAGLMAVMIGLFQIFLGVARLGVLVNFISDSVIIGFTTGAGVLIGASQLRHLFRLEIVSSSNLIVTLREIINHFPQTHQASLVLGVGVILLLALQQRFKPKWPGTLIVIIFSGAVVALFQLNRVGILVIDKLPRSLPPLAKLPWFDLDLIGQLSSGAFATGAIGLVSAVAISRSFAAKTGQRLDNNQEFIGQGMANILSGVFSGYCVFGSFTRSAVGYNAGGKTSLTYIFAGLFVLIAMLLLAPLAVFIPRAGLAGILLITAYNMIDRKEITRIWLGTRGDTAIMMVTFLSTLLLPLQFAVLAGILISFAVYIMRTSVPRVIPVVPAKSFSHFAHQMDGPFCPQLAILDIFGDLYFGAASHIEEVIREHLEVHPTQRFMLLRMFSVNQIDISGVHALESIVRGLRQRGGDVYMMRTQAPVLDHFKSTGFFEYLGADHFLSYGNAIGHLFYRVLDPTICIYECEARIFLECQNLPKKIKPPGEITIPTEIPTEKIESISPLDLWLNLRKRNPPIVVDVREPREFRRGHIPEALSIPLFELLSDPSTLPQIRPVVLVCRSGRRSTRAAFILGKRGFTNLQIVERGMLAWENELLLAAVDE